MAALHTPDCHCALMIDQPSPHPIVVFLNPFFFSLLLSGVVALRASLGAAWGARGVPFVLHELGESVDFLWFLPRP